MDDAEIALSWKMRCDELEREVERLRAAASAFVTAFEQRFKPTGIEDEFTALRRALKGGGEA
jgi:hypothetical protein